LSDKINPGEMDFIFHWAGRIVRIFFVVINFRKKLMKPQSTFGGAKNLTVANIALSEFLPKNSGHHLVILSYFAEGNWVSFVSSGNKG
jgi:hypothetical protein